MRWNQEIRQSGTYWHTYNSCSSRRKNKTEPIHRVFMMATMKQIMNGVSPTSCKHYLHVKFGNKAATQIRIHKHVHTHTHTYRERERKREREREREQTNRSLFWCEKGSDAKSIPSMSKQKCQWPSLALTEGVQDPSAQTWRWTRLPLATKWAGLPTISCVSRPSLSIDESKMEPDYSHSFNTQANG